MWSLFLIHNGIFFFYFKVSIILGLIISWVILSKIGTSCSFAKKTVNWPHSTWPCWVDLAIKPQHKQALSHHSWKIVDTDIKPQLKQTVVTWRICATSDIVLSDIFALLTSPFRLWQLHFHYNLNDLELWPIMLDSVPNKNHISR